MRRMWVAIPIGDHKGRVERVYGPFTSEDAAQAAASTLSTDPTECQAVPIEMPEWLLGRILAITRAQGHPHAGPETTATGRVLTDADFERFADRDQTEDTPCG